jgi:hypothetical protein
MADILTRCCNAYSGNTGDPCDRTAMADVLRRITEVILGLPSNADGRAVARLLLQAAMRQLTPPAAAAPQGGEVEA